MFLDTPPAFLLKMSNMTLKLPIISGEEDFTHHFHSDIWQTVAVIICERHRLSYKTFRRTSDGENIIFFVDDCLLIKIYLPFRDNYVREVAGLEFADSKTSIATPHIAATGDIEGWFYVVMTQLSGVPMRDIWREIEEKEQIEIVTHLGMAMKELHSFNAPLETPLNRDWHEFIEHQTRTTIERQKAGGANPEWIASLPDYLDSIPKFLPSDCKQVMLHGDIHPANVLLKQKNYRWTISGLFDFGDSLCGFHEYEFVAPGVLMVQGKRELQRAMLMAYGYKETELDSVLRSRLMLLTILYECSNLRKYAMRLNPEAVNFTLTELESAIWTFCV